VYESTGGREPMARDLVEPVDLRALEDTALGDPAFERRLLEVFLEDSEQQIAALEVALLAGRADDAKREAHTLKGAAGTLGAAGLGEVARQAEAAAAEGRLEVAAALLPELQAELLRVRGALEERLLGLR
jgi:two-component system, sensor histidine kinase and response regulator